MKDFYKRVEFTPAWHRVHEDPSKNYGVSGVSIHFLLVGENGAISWEIMTGWVLPETREWWKSRGIVPGEMTTAGGVGFHYPPERDDLEYLDVGSCSYLGQCRCDVGFLYGNTMMEKLIEGGEDALWAEMIVAYESMQQTEEED